MTKFLQKISPTTDLFQSFGMENAKKTEEFVIFLEFKIRKYIMRINFDASYKELARMFRKMECKGNTCGENKTTSEFDNALNISKKESMGQNVSRISELKESNENIKHASSYLSQDEISESNFVDEGINLENFNLEKAEIRGDFNKVNLSEKEDFYNKNIVNPPTIVSAKRIASDSFLTQKSINQYKANIRSSENIGNNEKATIKNVSYEPYSRKSKEDILKVILKEGQKQGIDPALAQAVAKVESSINPNAISRDGYASKGLFQLLDTTGKELMANFVNYENYRPYDIYQNTSLGISYLRKLHTMFSSDNKINSRHTAWGAADASSLEKFAVAAFNAGQGRVASAQQKAFRAGKDPRIFENVEMYLPSITRNYVRNVMKAKEFYA